MAEVKKSDEKFKEKLEALSQQGVDLATLSAPFKVLIEILVELETRIENLEK